MTQELLSPPAGESLAQKAFFDSIAERWDEWTSGKNAYYYQNITDFYRFVIPEGLRVLEVGCGTGNLLANLKPSYGLGLDFSPKMIEEAKKKYPGMDWRVMDIESEGPEGTFDFIILSNVVGYLSDIQAVLTRLKKNCEPHTRLVITYYNFLWEPLVGLADKMNLRLAQPLQNWLSPADGANILDLSGFELVKSGTRMLFPYQVPLLSEFLNRILSKIFPFSRCGLIQYFISRPVMALKPGSCSVIVPARNEEGNIKLLFERMPVIGTSTELVFVAGRSKDKTHEEIVRLSPAYENKFKIKILQDPPNGKGKRDAVREGFRNASGDYLFILDADLSVEPEEMPKFYEALQSGKGELVMGTRLVYPMEKQAMRLLNIMGNKFFSMFFSWILNQPIKDTLCGTKVLTRANYLRLLAGQKFFGEIDPFGDFDLILGASKLNMKILEIPIRYRARVYGETNIRRFYNGWQLLLLSLKALVKLKWNL